MAVDLVNRLLPVLDETLSVGFNVFDVMHHGTHEKQLSNVFAWLLDVGGSHNLGDAFLHIFLDEVEKGSGGDPLPRGNAFTVRQEVDTATAGGNDAADIADIVLESRTSILVIENYFTSDGHGHAYDGYLRHARREGHQGIVVLLCRDVDASRQIEGWENAVVVTYGRLLVRLHALVEADARYLQENPDAASFIRQMYVQFTQGAGRVSDRDVVEFVAAMCETGEASRFRAKDSSLAAEQFASDVANQARRRFDESRDLLTRAKGQLKRYVNGTLRRQLNETLVEGAVGEVASRYFGIYQWTIDVMCKDGADSVRLQIKFGPTAWFANEEDQEWRRTIDAAHVDYSRLMLTHAGRMELRTSSVGIDDVIAGLADDDRRLHDELVALLRGE